MPPINPLVGDIYTQTPEYHGRAGEITEQFETLVEARAYAEDFRSGALDPFLGHAWYRQEIRQNRNPDGTFGRGFTVSTDIQRPADGEDYDITEPVGPAPGPAPPAPGPAPDGGAPHAVIKTRLPTRGGDVVDIGPVPES